MTTSLVVVFKYKCITCISHDFHMIEDEEDLEESYSASYAEEALLEPRDPYSLRSLPHRIGTTEFLEEDDIGLREYVSDSEDELEGGGLYDTDEEEVGVTVCMY